MIKSIVENENGKSIRHPILWENGKITRLRGLEGDLGIESEESYGFALNKNGEVVGQSVAYLSYKNDICKQTHATIWTNGKAIDLHKKIPKTNSSSATGINDFGDVLIGRYLICNDDQTILFNHNDLKTTNTNYLYKNMYVMDKKGDIITTGYSASNKILYDLDSIWMTFIEIVSANDNGEIIARGMTIYGERHAMLLIPRKSN